MFFTSDHGLAVGEHGFLGKQSMYDHSIRVPFIVTDPDHPEVIRNLPVRHPLIWMDLD